MFILDEANTIQIDDQGARLDLLMDILKRERPNSKYKLLSPFIKEADKTITEWLSGGNSPNIRTRAVISNFVSSDFSNSNSPVY